MQPIASKTRESLAHELVAEAFGKVARPIAVRLTCSSFTSMKRTTGLFRLFAECEGFTIVTKDDDFSEMSLLRGFPPKVLYIGLGNCSAKSVESIFRAHVAELKVFMDDDERGILFLS